MYGKRKHLNHILALSMIIVLTVTMMIPLSAHAEKTDEKIVRVGWYDSAYNTMDEFGFRSGYAYEYQLKLAAYNGWSYEYVTGSWSDLLHMLETGEIDLLSDVSYTAKREEHMSFSSLPMGTEEYYLFKAPDNEQISPTNSSSLNGMKVGVNKDSIQADYYAEWTQVHGVNSEVILLTSTEEESLHKLESGELDAYITVDAFSVPTRAVPVFKIGSSDYYFAVSKSRPDLLEDLNFAMSRVQDENRYYNLQLYEKYIRRSGANSFL